MKIKGLFIKINFVLVAMLLAICFYDGFTFIYIKKFNASKPDLNWGVFLDYSFYYGLFPTLIISILLWDFNKKLFYLPLIILLFFIFYLGITQRPLRTFLLSFCYFFSFIFSFLIMIKLNLILKINEKK